jgi:hypothetical protein
MDEQAKPMPTAEQILESASGRRIKEIAWGENTFYAYGFTRHETKAWRKACVDAAGSVEADEYSDERMIAWMVRYADGRRVFTDEHITRLAAMNEADWEKLYLPCCEVNGWTKEASEHLRKNSVRTPNADSGSGSPPTSGSEAPTM